MDREVTRVLNFTKEEVQTALAMRLEQIDAPAPSPGAKGVKFSLSDSGATLEWVETHQINL